MTYPASIEFKRDPIAVTQESRPIFPIYYEVTLNFNALTQAQWSSIVALAQDGSSHSVMIPHPHTSTDTTFTSCYLYSSAQDRGMGMYVYGATVVIKRVHL